MSPQITHIIYDVDGLLLDTEPFYTKAHQILAARYGKVFDWSVKSKMIGLRAHDSAAVMINALGLPITIDEYLEQRRPLLEELFPQAEPMSGAIRLTRHLQAFSVPQGVATSSDRRHFELKTTRHRQWFSLFECTITGDDPEVKDGKPAPDIFLIAAKRLNALPVKCLVFEDSPSGIDAARAAGMYTIAVPDPNMKDAAYSSAHQIISNLNDLDLAYWGLPAFR
jgi:pseudouridine-5'-monophosphatase